MQKEVLVLAAFGLLALNGFLALVLLPREAGVSQSPVFLAETASEGTVSFEKNGYRFTLRPTDQGFTVNADPIIPGSTGARYFFTNESGVIRWSTGGPAGPRSPVLNPE